MTTPIACRFCVFWQRHREFSCNWGKCSKITNDSNLDGAKVYLFPTSAEGELHTNESFFCSEFKRKGENKPLTGTVHGLSTSQ